MFSDKVQSESFIIQSQDVSGNEFLFTALKINDFVVLLMIFDKTDAKKRKQRPKALNESASLIVFPLDGELCRYNHNFRPQISSRRVTLVEH